MTAYVRISKYRHSGEGRNLYGVENALKHVKTAAVFDVAWIPAFAGMTFGARDNL